MLVGHPHMDRSIFDLSNGFVPLSSWPVTKEDLPCFTLLIIQVAPQLNTKVKHGLTMTQASIRMQLLQASVTGWSKMNIALYNFHFRIPQAPSTHQMTQTSVTTTIVGDGDQTSASHFRLCSCSPSPASKGNKPQSPSAMICTQCKQYYMPSSVFGS